MFKIFIFISLCFYYMKFCSSFVAEDLIDELPGINYEINFKQYSGYLNADNESFLHYWLIESQNEPSKDPLLLWLNGGPCCSSVNDLFTLTGPFRVTDINKTVFENVYGWNKMANVLYLESPTDVGFSYTTNPNITYGDNQTALLNYNALKVFFEKYPEYSQRDFYISGFSYGGIYLPTLAMYLIKDPNIYPHLKGMAIGNPYISNSSILNTIVPFVYEHALVDEDLWNDAIDGCCDGNAMTCDYFDILQKSKGEKCYGQIILLSNIAVLLGLDPTNLYDTCYLDATNTNSMKSKLLQYSHAGRQLMSSKNEVEEIAQKYGFQFPNQFDSSNQILPDCAYSGVTNYLAREDVREAIHIPEFVQTWENCGSTCGALYEWQYLDMTQQLKAVVAAKVPILLFNGDVDTVCNVIGNGQYIAQLGLKKLKRTERWIYEDDIIKSAGMETQYEGLDYLTVRGAGHMVAMDRPKEALQMIANFIWNKDYSASTGIDVSPQPLLMSTLPPASTVHKSTTPPASTEQAPATTSGVNSPNIRNCFWLDIALVFIIAAIAKHLF